jgi:hypothetical protein
MTYPNQLFQVIGKNSVGSSTLVNVLDQLYAMKANGGYHAHVVSKFRGLKPTGFTDEGVA